MIGSMPSQKRLRSRVRWLLFMLAVTSAKATVQRVLERVKLPIAFPFDVDFDVEVQGTKRIRRRIFLQHVPSTWSRTWTTCPLFWYRRWQNWLTGAAGGWGIRVTCHNPRWTWTWCTSPWVPLGSVQNNLSFFLFTWPLSRNSESPWLEVRATSMA